MRPKGASSSHDQEQHVAFQTWVSKLSYDDLIQAMTFELDDSNEEFEILQELVKLQVPPPTPIHPRAMPRRGCAATTGRNERIRSSKMRLQRPRLFQLHPTNAQKRKHPSYYVLARKFVTAAGDVWSVGRTNEQERCDADILSGTTLRFRQTNKETTCLFVPEGDHSYRASQRKSVLRMLHVASRGRFLSVPHTVGSTGTTCYWSPWLDPTEHWFSLPLYLASRFEVALWTHFTQLQQQRAPHINSLRAAVNTLDGHILQQIACSATAKTLLYDVMPTDLKTQLEWRETMIWDLLGCHEETSVLLSLQSPLHMDQVALTDWGSPLGRFQAWRYARLQDEIALEIQKLVLNDFEMQEVIPTKSNILKKKTKRKKRRKQARPQQSIDESEMRSHVRECNDVDIIVPNHTDLSGSVEKTRTFVTVWKIIDDLVESVFEEAGLNDGGPDTIRDASPDRINPEIDSATTRGETRRSGSVDSASNHMSAELPLSELPPEHLRMNSPNGYQLFFSFLDSTHWKKEEVALEADLFDVSMPFDGTYRDPSRNKSAFVDFFLSQNKPEGVPGELPIASSTAASIASSTDKDSPTEVLGDEELGGEMELSDAMESGAVPPPDGKQVVSPIDGTATRVVKEFPNGSALPSPPLSPQEPIPIEISPTQKEGNLGQFSEAEDTFVACRSPSPPPPSTPPPQLSPILVSLADLQELRSKALSETEDISKAMSVPSLVHGSLPNSPIAASRTALIQSWSRDDLRSLTPSENHRSGTNNALKNPKLSYRSVAAKAVELRSMDDEGVSSRYHLSTCARSESSIEPHRHRRDESSRRSDHELYHGTNENNISANDGASTLGSTQTPRDAGQMDALRDERNSYRDMVLTLGAEVAKLKSLLAIQSGSSVPSFVPLQAASQPVLTSAASSGPDFMAPFFQGIAQSNSIAAMSDAGIPRGDQNSARSEDGTEGGCVHDSGRPRSVHVRRISSGATVAESDVSADQITISHHVVGPARFLTYEHDIANSIPQFGLRSRLTRDVVKFLEATATQLRKQASRKTAAVERLTRLATAVWPRAQVKIYGSHVTGLCLPSSDLDFVICLPAVHKNAPAVAPGVLEGRNAINESAQKIISRKLKGESWIDPRSIKLIEHTVVPIVKVATKDTKARTLQLDISFDGPEHHGIAAIEYVSKMMQELPMIQPLVLILKQFLLDRGLLTAYTGGLSSYCLILMVARFLQEQSASWDDCGSLLMAFLDFYGNSFDPRATGISVARRQYFSRPNYVQAPPAGQPLWPIHLQQHGGSKTSPPQSAPPRPDFLRRHSFTDKGSIDGVKGSAASVHGASPTMGLRPPRFQSSTASIQHHHHRPRADYQHPTLHKHQSNTEHSGRPYTFDPLFVEDPLSATNNIGRNAFRIFQVQRAFSDAHRALVASLEWDIHSSQQNDESEYPLLNCLLQSEDMFYDLEDSR